MMDFITPCCPGTDIPRRKEFSSARPSWLARFALAAVLLLTAPLLLAEGIQVKSATLEAAEDGYLLDAEFDINFNPALEEALTKGVTLNFIIEFELVRPRAYWFDEDIVNVKQNVRLSYRALTRQYQITVNTLHKNFSSLNEARQELSKVQSWLVAERGLLKKRQAYQAGVRMRLDVNQLPKPLQVDALGAKEWNLASDWLRFSVSP